MMDKGRLLDSTFEFSARLSECKDGEALSVPMSPADELFCNGRIRPIKPSAFPQKIPFFNFEHRSKAQSSVASKKGNDMEEKSRGRKSLWRNENDSSHRCPARSLSPQRNSSSHCEGEGKGQRNYRVIDDSAEEEGLERIKVVSTASPSTFLKPRGSRRKWSLRDIFLRRSKSDGRERERDEMELSFSSYAKLSSSDKEKNRASAQGKPAHKKMADTTTNRTAHISTPNRKGVPESAQELHYISSPNRRGVPASTQELHYIPSPNRRGVPVSAHELHYTANRAQAEELRRKTVLPYRQGVLGCLRFPSPPAFPQGQVLQPLY
jgi:hypothetical protein